jgi:2-oxopent-4-enoate/cis-2-oxohex-4-enoate hydratase
MRGQNFTTQFSQQGFLEGLFKAQGINYNYGASSMMDKQIIAQLGNELYDALYANTTLPPLTDKYTDITVEDAYYISLHMMERRVARGEKIVGKKIGVTSAPVQEMLNVFQPDFGFLTDTMAREDGSTIVIADSMIQPRAEGEIAFRLKKDLVGPGITEQDVLDATETIIPCFEIVDSRIHDWKIKIQDTVADNASCGAYVLSKIEVDPRDYDLPNLKMKVFKNGELHSEGIGAAVQGNPLASVAWLANTLGEFEIPFEAGEIILSGSLVPLIPVVAGDEMSLEIEGIGGCSCNFG